MCLTGKMNSLNQSEKRWPDGQKLPGTVYIRGAQPVDRGLPVDRRQIPSRPRGMKKRKSSFLFFMRCQQQLKDVNSSYALLNIGMAEGKRAKTYHFHPQWEEDY
jgi:hypothetical protein